MRDVEAPSDIRYELTVADYVEAMSAHLRSSGIWKVMLAVGLFNIGFGIYLLLRETAAAVYVLPLLLGLLAVFGPLLMLRLQGPALFRRQPNLAGPVLIRLTNVGLAVSGESASGDERWSMYSAYLESKHLFLLYSTPRTFRLIPKRAFPDAGAADDFRQLLVDQIKVVRKGFAF